jgi:hypothetical protein
MADSAAPWAAPGPSAPPTRPQSFSAGPATGRASAAPAAGAFPARPADPTAPAGAAKPARRTGTRPIPLRPLSVLEVIDAGVGSLRSSPRRVHVTALLVTIGICLLGLACLLLFQHRLNTDVRNGRYTTTDFFGDSVVYVGAASGVTSFGKFLTDVLFAVVFSGMAAAFTAGLYTTSAQRYVDGLPPDAAAARAGYRGRIAAMAWLTVLISIPRLTLLGLSMLTTLSSVDNPRGGLFAWLLLIGGPICLLTTSLFAVALPALILERIPVRKAVYRTRKLAQGGIWRSGWTCLFTLLMTYTPLVLMTLYGLHNQSAVGDSGSFSSNFSIIDFVLAAAVIVLTVPLRASTATMLYVDRRFRREGLDVRIAWARVAKETL